MKSLSEIMNTPFNRDQWVRDLERSVRHAQYIGDSIRKEFDDSNVYNNTEYAICIYHNLRLEIVWALIFFLGSFAKNS